MTGKLFMSGDIEGAARSVNPTGRIGRSAHAFAVSVA